MSFGRLLICVGGVYTMFLIWAIAQERLSVPFKQTNGDKSDKFKSALFISTCQAILSTLSAFIYIQVCRKPGESFLQSVGLTGPTAPPPSSSGNGHSHLYPPHSPKHPDRLDTRYSVRPLLVHYFQCACFITSAAPFGFAALSYISYPAMVLGKSCKLVPVMIMNVLMYHRKFARHKYIVVAMVTAGITLFMFFGDDKKKKSSGGGITSNSPYASLIGITYLLINLALDGATNSTQDEIFTRHRVTGQQMMFFINIFTALLNFALAVLPLPTIPVIHPSAPGTTELGAALAFIRTHDGVLGPLLQFALTGAMGQLFIFETLQHFGSLTLVTITLTRKLFTMLLSVVVYNHKLTLGQWFGAAVVFAGISVEAYVKRRDVHAKRVVQEKEKAKIKSL